MPKKAESPLGSIDGFEWDEGKRKRVLEERSIDFVDAAKILLRPCLSIRSDQNGEERYAVVGPSKNGVVLAVIVTKRANRIRIISARKARKNEEHAYRSAIAAQESEG